MFPDLKKGLAAGASATEQNKRFYRSRQRNVVELEFTAILATRIMSLCAGTVYAFNSKSPDVR